VRTSCIVFLAVLATWWVSGTALAAASPDELIVRFEPGVSAAERAAIREDAGTALERTLPVRGMNLVEVEPGLSAGAAERSLERADGVMYAEPNAPRYALLHPDDPYFSLLWAMENTGQSIRGVPGSPDADTDAAEAWDAIVGGGTVVAVIDTGIDGGHPDLAAAGWRNAGESGSGRETNGIDDDLNGRVDDWRGWDFVADDANPADENGHGTHVAGTVGAQRGNGIGVAGVAHGTQLMPLRVLDADGTGSVADVILAYAYAASEGADIVNLSLGSSSFSRAERDAIAAFPGMLFVAAAGNGGSDGVGDNNNLDPEYPCAYVLPHVVCVGASDNRDQLASFSNYGSLSVHLVAPGVSIASTLPGGGYGWSSGTSMATPHVTGAAALLWAAAPGASVSDIKSALLNGTDVSPQFSGRTVTGGRLNVFRSLEMVAELSFAAPAPAPPPAAPSAPPSGGPRPGRQKGLIGDRTPPRLWVRVVRRHRLSRLVRRGIVVRLRSSERCSVRLRLRTGRRVLAATAPRSIRAGASKRIVLRIRRAARARLSTGAPRRARLVVRATDRWGNRRTIVVRLALRR
jgi:thermitase